MDDEKLSAYEAEVTRMHDTYGPSADIPNHPYGQIRTEPNRGPSQFGATPGMLKNAVPINPIDHRIEGAARQLVEAGHELQSARSQTREAVARKEQWERTFTQISNELMQLIHEHREGTPEGVPYQR